MAITETVKKIFGKVLSIGTPPEKEVLYKEVVKRKTPEKSAEAMVLDDIKNSIKKIWTPEEGIEFSRGTPTPPVKKAAKKKSPAKKTTRKTTTKKTTATKKETAANSTKKKTTTATKKTTAKTSKTETKTAATKTPAKKAVDKTKTAKKPTEKKTSSTTKKATTSSKKPTTKKTTETKSTTTKKKTATATTKSTTTKKSPAKGTVAKKENVKKTTAKKVASETKTTTKKKTTTTKKTASTTKSTTSAKGSKRDAKIALYIKDIKKHYGEVDEAFVAIIVKNLGPAIYRKDAELVSCSDPKELDTVRRNFLIKKLGIDASKGVLDAAIQDVCEELKGVRTKYRATFYYSLAKKFKKESVLS